MQHILRLRLKHEMADLKNLDQRGESTHHVCGWGCGGVCVHMCSRQGREQGVC